MTIDFHTHMFPDKIAKGTLRFLASVCHIEPYTDGTYEGLKASAIAAGVDISVALPIVTKPSQFESINRFAAEHQEGRIVSFGSIHPDSHDYKHQLRQIKSMGMKGIKLHPDYQEVYFDDIRYKRIVDYASELGLIISVHAGQDPKCPEDVHCTPQMAAELIDEVHPEKLVLAHLGGNGQWDQVEEHLVGKHVYFDTGVVLGRISDDQFIRIARTHGSDKILFATDSPWAGQKEFISYLESMDLTEEEKRRISGENAMRILGLL
ncbi:amidohydrolase family protein [Dorea sp. D27]|uniref:amidohydrolase family protein n=1 Tax=Dorea sp. D27 TaxID=658665 RepID=UPI0006737FDE|nr:amidohydrolase family protein [Dorea sp. D27]KMZ54951.1 metal-dependent hydrolase of the TIM-barrel fold protein [Dorea sp. D27]